MAQQLRACTALMRTKTDRQTDRQPSSQHPHLSVHSLLQPQLQEICHHWLPPDEEALKILVLIR